MTWVLVWRATDGGRGASEYSYCPVPRDLDPLVHALAERALGEAAAYADDAGLLAHALDGSPWPAAVVVGALTLRGTSLDDIATIVINLDGTTAGWSPRTFVDAARAALPAVEDVELRRVLRAAWAPGAMPDRLVEEALGAELA